MILPTTTIAARESNFLTCKDIEVLLLGGKMVFEPRSPGLVQLLTHVLQSVQQTEEITVVPNFLIPRRVLPSQLETESLFGSKRIEDQVLAWFRKNHFEGDRAKMNLHGYRGLLYELREIPPWVEDITMDEFFGEASEEGEREFRPLYTYCLELGEKMLETYKEYLVRRRERSPFLSRRFERERLGLKGLNEREDLDESERLDLQGLLDASDKGLLVADKAALDDLERKIKLACLLGSEAIESLYEAITSYYDEYRVVGGAPDLFLWHPNPAYNLWFFAEVKGPRDHLRESQLGWMRGFCEHFLGRVMILHVC